MNRSSQFEIGQYYYVELYPGKYLIVLYDRPVDRDTVRINGQYVGNMNGVFHLNRDGVFIGVGRTCRIATYEERCWLDDCIKANKVVEKKPKSSYSLWF